jgi:hypothetical protein
MHVSRRDHPDVLPVVPQREGDEQTPAVGRLAERVVSRFPAAVTNIRQDEQRLREKHLLRFAVGAVELADGVGIEVLLRVYVVGLARNVIGRGLDSWLAWVGRSAIGRVRANVTGGRDGWSAGHIIDNPVTLPGPYCR